jgi:hypothetical protein
MFKEFAEMGTPAGAAVVPLAPERWHAAQLPVPDGGVE